jgi:hypothetical protein
MCELNHLRVSGIECVADYFVQFEMKMTCMEILKNSI